MDSPGCLSDSGIDWDLTFAGIDALSQCLLHYYTVLRVPSDRANGREVTLLFLLPGCLCCSHLLGTSIGNI